MKRLFTIMLFAVMLLPWMAQAQTTPAVLPYTCGFEDTTDNANWVIENGASTNKFFIGSVTNASNGGANSLYISNSATGTTYNYSTGSSGYVYAYREFSVTTAGAYVFSYDWKANGESSWDYIRVFIVPSGATTTLVPSSAGSSSHSGIGTSNLPSDWIALDGGSKLNQQSSWQTHLASDGVSLDTGTHKLVFYWRNDGSGGTQPPAAIDNIQIAQLTCPSVSNIVASGVTATNAVISWHERGTATQWIIEYDTTGFVRGNGIIDIATDTTYSIMGLEANTEYTVYVRALCGVGDTSLVLSTTFRTQCTAYDENSLPITENFENYPATSSPTSSYIDACWTKWSTSTSTYTTYPYVATTGGSKTMYMYSSSTVQSVLVSPMISADMSTLQVSFDIYLGATSASNPLMIGVISDPNDVTTFDTIALVSASRPYVWEHYSIPLHGYTGQGTNIAFVTPTAESHNYIDNIVIGEIDECSAPINVVASNISSNSATISWTDPVGTSWIVEYGVSGFTPGSGTVEYASSTSVTLSGLSASTGYDVYVSSDCGSDTSYNAPRLTFRTECTTYLEVPFYENFESYGFGSDMRPECWYYGGYSASYPYVTAEEHASGIASLYMYTYKNSSDTTRPWTYYMSPEIDVTSTPIQSLSTTFRMLSTYLSSSYPGMIVVGISSDTADIKGTFYAIDTLYCSVESVWEEQEVSFAGYPDNLTGKYIVIASAPWNTSSYAYNEVYIDDVKVDYIPTCTRPTTFEVATVTGSSVSFVWQDEDINHNEWEIAYGPVGFNPDAIDETYIGTLLTGIYDDSTTVDNLSSGTMMDFYLRANCGGGDLSPWRGPITTGAGIINVPLSGVDSIIACGAVICDNGGLSGAYLSNSNGMVIVYPSSPDSVVAVVGGSINTESNYDYVKIYDGEGVSIAGLLYEFSGELQSFDTIIKSSTGPLTIQFISDGGVNHDGFYFQTACLEAPQCPEVRNITAASVAGRSAYITWRYNENLSTAPVSYDVELRDSVGIVGTYTRTETNILLSDLDPETPYLIKITAICEDNILGPTDSLRFTTRCLASTDVTIGSGSTTVYYMPACTYYSYSYNQQMYTAAEVGSAAPLQSITFYVESGGGYTRNIVVSLAQTTQNTLTTSNPILPSAFTTVYSGTHSFVEGANTITFTTPFNFDGTSNLVVAVDDNTGSWEDDTYYESDFVSDMAIYEYQDDSDLVPGSVSFSASSYRNKVSFSSCDTGTCVAPNVIVTNIQSTQVDVIWAAGNGETSWTVEYRMETDTVWTMANANETNTYYSFTNLSDATDYVFRVTTTCGSQTVSRMVRATTKCLPISTYPFYENFESWSGEDLPTICWDRLSNNSWGVYPYVSTYMSLSPTKSLNFQTDQGEYSSIILPEFNLPADTLQVAFSMYGESGDQLMVGVITDPDDLSTFRNVATATLTASSQWQFFEFPLNSYTGNNGRIVILAPSGDYTYPYLDNLEVFPIPSCVRPTNVTVDATTITTTSAVVTWTDSVASSWVVEYGPRGFVRGTGTTDIASNGSYTITGLDHSTYYDVYVYAVCSVGDTSFATPVVTFATACGTIDVLPFYDQFDGYETGSSTSIPHYPLCWNGGSNYSTTYPYFNSTNYSGTNSASEYLYAYASTSERGTKYTHVALPAIDTTQYQITDMMVSFAVKAGTVGSSYDARLYVGIANNPTDPTSFVAVDTITATNTNWNYVSELEFSSYAGTGKYIVLWICPQTASTSSFYIDNIEVDLIPTCRRPQDVTVIGSTATTVDLSWTERNAATSWVIEYDTAGFTPGTGTTVVANSNPFTVTGLTAITQYDFYVKSTCSATDESRYNLLPASGWTSQVPATVPYTYDFETATEWNNWATTSNTTANWARGTATAAQGLASMYVSADSGATNSTVSSIVNATTYRDFDFGANDTNFTITFKAKAGGRTDGNYDGLMLYLVDPWVDVTSSTSSLTTPWGHVNNIPRIDGLFVRLDTVFDEYAVELERVSGVKRLAFYYFNQSFNDVFVGGPAAVDDINIVYTSCPRPVNLVASNITSSTATLSWDASASGYVVYYRGIDDTVIYSQYSASNSCVITGLTDAPKQYLWAVRAICGTDTSLYSTTETFTTSCYDGSFNAFPFVESFENPNVLDCWNQEYIYSSNDWYLTNTVKNTIPAYDSTNLVIFITSSYDGYTTTLITPALDLTAVSDPYIKFAHIQPEWSGDQDTLGVYYRTSPAADWVYLASYTTDISAWQVDSLALPNASTEYQIGFRASSFYGYGVGIDDIVIDGSTARCPAPMLTASVVNNNVTISWSDAGDYELRYRKLAETDYGQTIFVTNNNTYTINGLDPLTDYVCQVRKNCGADLGYSAWAEVGFTTEELPCGVPTNIAASNITYTSATISWTDPNGTQSSWNVEYSFGGNTETVTANTNSVELTGLYAGTAYNVRVQGICSADVVSEWSEVYTFNTATCQTVSNVTATEVGGTRATITWTPLAGQTKWEVRYGMIGTNEENCTPVIVEGNPTCTIEGLETEITYDVYVRNICGDDIFSAWTTKYQFTTTVGINTASNDNVSVQIYPNPANTEATVSVDGIEGKVEFVVADMNGRMIVTETINCEGSLVKTIDVSNLAKGAYFVHIYNSNFNTTRKLVVK